MNLRKLDEIDILGIKYSITYHPDYIDNHNGQCLGLCKYDDKEIHVKFEEDINVTLHTLCHEVLHAYSHELGIPVLKEKENHSELDTIALCMSHFITTLIDKTTRRKK